MSTMIERVARAILKRRFYDCEPELYNNDVDEFVWKLDPDHIIDAHEEARAAIEAVTAGLEEARRNPPYPYFWPDSSVGDTLANVQKILKDEA